MSARGFLKVPHVFFDSNIAGAVGREALLLYLNIRRFEQREPYSPKIGKLMEAGWIVSYANQTSLALRSGMSRSTISRGIKRLKAVGWIDDFPIKDNGRAYKIGHNSEVDEDGRVFSVYWADRWLEQTLPEFPKDTKGWKHANVKRRVAELERQLNEIASDPDLARSLRRGEPGKRRDASVSSRVVAPGRHTSLRHRSTR